jgi:hypothetical protein
MSLESLSNSLERSLALNGQRQGTAVTQLRSSPLSNSAEWSASAQYLVGDWVVDPVDGQMYCYGGELVVFAGPPVTTEIKTSVLGGLSPYAGGAGWLKAGPTGVNQYETLLPSFTYPLPVGATPPAAWTGGANNVITVPDFLSAVGTEWLITVQGTITYPAAQVATDIQTLTLTATGTGSVSASWTIQPTVGSTTTDWSCSLVVQTGTTPAPPLAIQTITLGGGAVGTATAATSLTNLRLTAVRLS